MRKTMKESEFIELKALVNVVKQDVDVFKNKYDKDMETMGGVMKDFILIKNMTTEHEDVIKDLVKLIKTGNGVPSMIDDIRAIKKYQSTISFWLTAIAMAFLGQFVVLIVAAFIWVLRAMAI
jgi:hypothetical protein